MRDILEQFMSALSDAGNNNVFLAFDALPVRDKGTCFTVLGIKSFEASAPVYSQFTVFIPFKAEVEVSVYANEAKDMSSLLDYFETKVRPAIDSMTSLNTRICRLSVKHDSNLKRLVLSAGVSVCGVRRIGRNSV